MRHHHATSIAADRLRDVPGLDALQRHTRVHLDALSTPCRVAAGEVFIKQGNPGRQSFLIVEGTASIRCDGSIVAERTSGDLVGEAAVLLHCPRNADVVAATDLTVLVISPAELATLCQERDFRGWLDNQIGAHAAVA